MQAHEVEDFTFGALGEQVVEHSVRGVFTAHKTASEEAARIFEPQERLRVEAIMRWGKVQEAVRSAADRNGLMVETVINDGGWSCTEVRSGQVVLAPSAVPHPCGPVKESRYRKSLARSNELTLWEQEPPEETDLLVLLIHSKYIATDSEDWSKHRHLPGSVWLAWPDPDLRYVHSVNLFQRYPHIVEAHTPEEWDAEARVRYIGRSRRAYGS